MNHSYLLGKLQAAVEMYLAGVVDRDFLAKVYAETMTEAEPVAS